MNDKGLTTRIVAIHETYPAMLGPEIAYWAGCSASYVRAVKRRHQLAIRPAMSGPKRASAQAFKAQGEKE